MPDKTQARCCGAQRQHLETKQRAPRGLMRQHSAALICVNSAPPAPLRLLRFSDPVAINLSYNKLRVLPRNACLLQHRSTMTPFLLQLLLAQRRVCKLLLLDAAPVNLS